MMKVSLLCLNFSLENERNSKRVYQEFQGLSTYVITSLKMFIHTNDTFETSSLTNFLLETSLGPRISKFNIEKIKFSRD